MKTTCGSPDAGVSCGWPDGDGAGDHAGTGSGYLAPKDCEPGQGRPARHSALAIRSCNDLAQPGTGLVKDRDACAAR